ncbi:MAG: hypothetical protein Q8R83_06765 [Legionellaceae bacterium]|nr:hypothetical protein [Legionellaceae bacterium]
MLKQISKYIILSYCFCVQAHAFTCYITMVKDSCWKDYNLIVRVSDASTNAESTTITVPAGKLWERQEFECKEKQTLALVAQFNPVFWSGDENKTFPAQRYWKLPDNIESGITGWNVTVCFPKWFADVPLPPHATADCKCDMDSIPPIPPVQSKN